MPIITETNGSNGLTVIGKLVTKRIFLTRRSGQTLALCSLTLLRSDGSLVDIQCWSSGEGRKAYCVYRKVERDRWYKVTDVEGLVEPDERYSTSDYITKSSRWMIEPYEKKGKLNRMVKCCTSIQKTIQTIKDMGTANVLGRFVSLHRGPSKFGVQGYYVKLEDNNGDLFNVLVWHLARIDRNKYELLHCTPGKTVLIMNCRPSRPPTTIENSRNYTFTSICTPVVDSGCVSQEIKVKPVAMCISAYTS